MQDLGRWEFIYDQINGMLQPDVCGWVQDETAEGGELAPLVEQVYEARNRLCERLGADPDTDEDFELLISGFEGLSRACGKLMYRYGYQAGVNMGIGSGGANVLEGLGRGGCSGGGVCRNLGGLSGV